LANNHWLFVASTPRHLYQSIAIAFDQQVPCSIVLFGLDFESPMVNAVMQQPIFDSIVRIDQPKQSQDRKRAFADHQQRISDHIRNVNPGCVVVGNDFQPISQWVLHQAKQQNADCQGIYVDEGTGTYVTGYTLGKRINKWLEGAVKTLSYGSWYRRPAQLGLSRYIDQRWVDIPALDAPFNGKQLHSSMFSTPKFIEFATSVANDLHFDAATLANIKVLFIVANLSMMDRLYGGLDKFHAMIRSLHASGISIALKMHPRNTDGIGIDDIDLTYLPAALPAELIFAMLPPKAVVVGDLSSAMVSAVSMLGNHRTVSIETQASPFTEQMKPILNELQVTPVPFDQLQNTLQKLQG